MKNLVLLFPGQGSQYVGMGKSEDHHIFHSADKILGYDLSKLCFEGPEETLKLTSHTQPALLTHSLVLFEKLQSLIKNKPVTIKAVLGHSVGEYAALTAAGVLSFESAVKAVKARGEFMQAATPIGVGAMIAILRLNEEWVLKACQAVSKPGFIVEAANFNDPQQIVISGHKEACEAAVEWLKQNCPDRMGAIPLNVSAPFHCSLMNQCAERMKHYLQEVTFKPNQFPYVANVDAKLYPALSQPEEIKARLIQQISGTVKWSHSFNSFSDEDLFVEVGPGKVLTGLLKKIKPQAKCLPLDIPESWNQLKELV